MVELVTSDGDTFKIGQRVMIAGSSGSNTGTNERGTIRYIGPIPPNEGTWLGVDWDNPSRGKHDGVHNGVRYFTARHPTSGSFVKKEKIDSGRNCVEAIKLRYGVNVHGSDVEEQLQQVKKAFNAPFLEMVGFEDVNKKQSCFETLRVVWLHDYGVSNAGKPNELKELSPRIKELDLSKNLLSSWHEVVAITCQLGNLHLLNLSENMLVVPDENEIHELCKQDAFRSLQYLILSTMEYTWSDILHCASLWPNIQHLQAPFNIVTSLELPEKPVFYNLRQLDLEGNKIENWEEINKLGMLPLLERLNLVNTDMSNILIPGDVNLFCSLKHLLLSHNKISSWRDINELDKLKLQDLRFRENPVLREYSKETSRQLIIAKIASIKMLDGQEIIREERRGAEYDYIKRNGKQWQESKDDANLRVVFLNEHPRYTTLIKKYGEAESSEYKEVKNKLKSSLIKLEIVAQPTDKAITKSLPRSMLVQKLVGLVQKLFNTGTIIPNLSVLSSTYPDLKITLDNHLKNLDFYSVEDGDKILVEW